MNFNKKLANRFVEAISGVLPENFGVLDDTGEPICLYDIEDAINRVDPDATVQFGATKLVIISRFLHGVVLKIPFRGRWFPTAVYYEEEDWDFDEAYEFEPFGCEDYCLEELNRYIKLKEKDFAMFFSKTEKLCEDPRIGTVIVQEETITKSNTVSRYRASEKASRLSANMNTPMDSLWVALCIDEYGEDLVKDFFAYCRDEDEDDLLSDCHYDNYGYRKKDRSPCILDFSGYRE